MHLRPTAGDDLELVLEMEAAPDVARYSDRWPLERHRRAIEADDEGHLMVLEDDRPCGFILLAGLGDEHRSVELRRIVVQPSGAGLGRRAIQLALAHAFDQRGAHRVWLDVMPANERARRAYAACGLVVEATLRDALLKEGRFESLVVMSILAGEWAARAGTTPST
jgi:diamine N-acetyltransferase